MDLKRRDFLKIFGGATVATALPACVPKKPQSLIPYIIPHEEIVPGKSVWYAGVCRECPAGCGIHVRVRDGRAVKTEGNPLHPVNAGALCARGQASLHGLYNPDRIQHPMQKREDGSWEQLGWDQAMEILAGRLNALRREGRGADVAWLTSHLTGSLDFLIDELLRTLGSRQRIRYEPIAWESIRQANRQTFGLDVIPTYDFSSAEAIVSFGADFLETWLSPVEHTRQFTAARAFRGKKIAPFYYIGPRFSMTAANADEWIAPRPGTESAFAAGLLNIILTSGRSRLSLVEANDLLRLTPGFGPRSVSEITGVAEEAIRRVASALLDAPTSLVVGGGPIAGNEREVETLVAVNLINYALGNIGKTVRLDLPSGLSNLSSYSDLHRLVGSMERGEVAALFVSDANPAYATPTTLNFRGAMSKVPLTVAFSSFMDETTAAASLILPIHTPLESWGDFEARPGIVGLMQPVMQPVFKTTRPVGDILVELKDRLTGRETFSKSEQPFLEYLKFRWRAHHRRARSKDDFETWWTEVLANGGFFEERKPPTRARPLRVRAGFTKPEPAKKDFALLTFPSIALYDGRGANRPWLQELPDPITQITWDSWVEIHPDDAQRLAVERGDIVRVESESGSIEVPAYVTSGVRPGTVAIPLGQGHTEYGRYARGNGANVIAIFPSSPLDASGGLKWSNHGVRLTKGDRTVPLADVAGSDYLHGRNIVQIITAEELLRQTKELKETQEEKAELSLYPPHEHPEYRWGMTIDLDKCTGCSACVTACYAENNIPVVGKRQVELGRELSWIRIERYFDDASADPRAPLKAEFLPMMCQQCDNAPCEPVCPVYASYHTPEGLNAQVYNRCVGTRYCSNNCPYKVRRFNWFDYEFPEPLNWQLNPDVTVRSKGVMEKCTFCVQRIVEAKNMAKLEGRTVSDGEIKTACQQACPAQAIVFGDLKDPGSEVNKQRAKNHSRGYRVLEELNTQPAVTYLKEIRSGTT